METKELKINVPIHIYKYYRREQKEDGNENYKSKN